MKNLISALFRPGVLLWGLVAAFVSMCLTVIPSTKTNSFGLMVFNRKDRRTFAAMHGLPFKSLGRFRTCDVAFPYRMGAGVPGDVNRTHPASIETVIIDPTNPPLAFGVPVLISTATANTVRPFGAGDSAVTSAYGWMVRPYPVQAGVASGAYGAQGFGGGAPVVNTPQDVLRFGYIMVQVSAATAAAAKKGGRVYIWIGATGGGHTQGGVEAAASSANTIELGPNVQFNGPTDANGVTEISIVTG